MRRVIPLVLAAVAFAALPGVVFAAPGAKQKLPSRKQAEAMLQAASDAANIFYSADTRPYHLIAAVHYTLGNVVSTGQYELLWAAPDIWHEGFDMQYLGLRQQEVDVARGEKRYRLRSTAALPLPLWLTRQKVHDFYRTLLTDKQRPLNRVFWGDDKRQVCVETGSDYFPTTTCFDPATGDALSSAMRPRWNNPATASSFSLPPGLPGALADNFTSVGNRRFPIHIFYRALDVQIDITVTLLSTSQHFGKGTFDTRPDAVVSDWCPQPDYGPQPRLSPPPVVTTSPPGHLLAYSYLVQTDGSLTEIEAERSGGREVDATVEKWLRNAKMRIASCHGKPIEYRSMFTPPTRIIAR